MSTDFSLERMLHPITVAEFFERYHERQPLVLQRQDPGWYGDVLTIVDIDHVLTSIGLRHPSIRVVKDAGVVPVEEYTRDYPWGSAVFDGVIDGDRVTTLFQQGHTVILEALHRWWQPLGYLCRSLEEQFWHPVQTNIYVTPRGSQGFAAHYDSHDVFVLQVGGSKRWRIYEGPVRLPGRRQAFDKAKHQPGRLIRELEVETGDLLYLPRGYMHEAFTADSDSIHITVGLLPQTWYDVFLEAVKAIEDDERFRESLPRGWDRDHAGLQGAFEERLQVLREQTDLGAVLAGLSRQFVENRAPLVDGAFASAWDFERVTADSCVRRRAGLLYQIEDSDDGGSIEIVFHRKRVTLPGYCRGAVEFLAGGEACSVDGIPDLDDDGKLVLARRLVREGFLVLEPS